MSGLIHLLDRPIAYQPAFAQLRVGKMKSGPTAAVFLSQLVYWHNRMDGGWMYKTREDIKKETGLSRDEQETARKRLVTLGVLEEDLRGVPATVHYRINIERLELLLLHPDRAESQMAATPPTGWRQPRQLDGGNPANKMAATPPTSWVESRQQVGGDPAIFPIRVGDMTKIAAAVRCGEVFAPDVLVGGTPCQAFSIAGLRNGLTDSRGQLTLAFVELVNAIDEKRREQGKPPVIVLWENVPGVFSSKDNAFGCFLAGLELSGAVSIVQPGIFVRKVLISRDGNELTSDEMNILKNEVGTLDPLNVDVVVV